MLCDPATELSRCVVPVVGDAGDGVWLAASLGVPLVPDPVPAAGVRTA
jgi:hypothetical protein